MLRPDFNTINLFRKKRLADVMDDIFTQVVQMLVDAVAHNIRKMISKGYCACATETIHNRKETD